jgi:RNA polymerase sigma-70 factor (ECF subfamily)
MMAGIAEASWEGQVGVDADVARLRKGDPEALGALLERYQNRLYRYLLRLVREPATAEDLFQQTWLRVAEQVKQYDPRRSFDAWLFTVARNLAIDHLRRYRPESLDEPLPSGESREGQIPGAGETALERVILQERAARLTDAMGSLPAVYREVLTLRFEEEMKLEEIAVVLDAPLSTVKTRLRRSLEGLRRKLELQGPVEDWR